MEFDVEFPLDLEASIPVAKGFAVCVCDKYIVITQTESCSVAVYDATTLELVCRFGARGSDVGQFAFNSGLFNHFHSGLCPCPGASPGVLIADGDNGRVSEHLIPRGDCVRLLGLTHLHHPRGVDATDTHIAVSDVSDACSRVLLFSCNAVDDVAPLWVFGSTHGSSLRQLFYPYGLRLSKDGSVMCVADCMNHRVVKIQVHNADSDAVVLVSKEHSLEYPRDVMECGDGGLLIANSGENNVMKVGHNGTVTRFGTPGRDNLLRPGRFDRQIDGDFNWPTGLAFCPVNDVLIVRDTRRLQLFNVRWTRSRANWIAACAEEAA